ncbi:molybdopterin oxidoreductase family protein [Lacipirellula parvula]|uniref:Nitrate reductase NapA subunit n=1 Tax=Lacipirellula parvula TaxID=2650471 RepID=A0A5K7XIZ2_9BACT|nr:nitrate reductase [Lacipirellula parvula]BBO36027.1 nitrate reductase NapA subunit [Lacipirellula parvula]
MSQAPTNGTHLSTPSQRFIPRLLQRTGPLTESLALNASEFGPRLLPPQMHGDRATASVCGFCSTGCNLNVHQRGDEALGLSPATDYPVNLGMACPKGWEALAVLDAPDRATRPLLRNAVGKLEPVGWDVAATTFGDRMQAIQREHGPQSVAFLSTGQIVTEEMALLGALAKFGMGMLHGDGNTRQCMATAVVAYKQAFGFDAPPYTYADFEQSDTIVLVGSNLCIAHPILWQRVMRNQFDPQIIAIDPRTTETTMAATQHLALQPKSDLALFYGVAHLLIEREWIDREFIDAHTSGFDEFAAFVSDFPLSRVVAETGLAAEVIERFAESIHNGLRVSFWWTMGVNQSHQAVRTAQAIINLALMTGNIGRPGTGANSITGQCNAMGSRLFSNTTNLLGGHDFASAEDRQKVAGILAIDESRIPHEASWPYHRIMEGILRREIRGLWVVATNPAHSWINQETARDVLSRLDFLVVQDMYHSTETARIADLVLPAAGWGEKEGTFINSERRIGVTSKVARAPGEALADFHIFKLLAEYWGCGEMFRRWESPAATFEILKQLSAGQPCDVAGIDGYAMLRERGGVQWPYPAESDEYATERRLFADGRFFHPDGRAKFLCEEPRPLPEPTTSKFPLTLLTGRGSVAQWHTQTRTAKSAVLRKLYPEELYVEINPHDAAGLLISSGDLIIVASQRGELRGRAMVTPAVQPGQVFIPMHYEATNRLTHPSFDPYSHQPSYKACAVRVAMASN